MNGQQIDMTPTQTAAVDRLTRAGWTVTRWACEDDPTVYLARRDRKIRSMTRYAEVDAEGTTNGDSA